MSYEFVVFMDFQVCLISIKQCRVDPFIMYNVADVPVEAIVYLN